MYVFRLFLNLVWNRFKLKAVSADMQKPAYFFIKFAAEKDYIFTNNN